jgi:hypothetical protein
MDLRVVGVHGVRNFLSDLTLDEARQSLARTWSQALEPSVGAAGHRLDLRVAYYAPHVNRVIAQDAADGLDDLTDDEYRMLVAWAAEADALPPGTPQATVAIPARMLAEALTEDPTNKRALRVLVRAFLREVSAYLDDVESHARDASRARVADAIREHSPHIVIAHSLGSVVCYEALFAYPDLRVDLLITVGSPLAMNGVIFDRLVPAPVDGRGQRPPNIGRWVNVADPGDVVAVPRPFTRRFDPDENEDRVHIDSVNFHGVERYLTSPPVIGALIDYAATASDRR